MILFRFHSSVGFLGSHSFTSPNILLLTSGIVYSSVLKYVAVLNLKYKSNEYRGHELPGVITELWIKLERIGL